jgi:hypothetical protein
MTFLSLRGYQHLFALLWVMGLINDALPHTNAPLDILKMGGRGQLHQRQTSIDTL